MLSVYLECLLFLAAFGEETQFDSCQLNLVTLNYEILVVSLGQEFEKRGQGHVYVWCVISKYPPWLTHRLMLNILSYCICKLQEALIWAFKMGHGQVEKFTREWGYLVACKNKIQENSAWSKSA